MRRRLNLVVYMHGHSGLEFGLLALSEYHIMECVMNMNGINGLFTKYIMSSRPVKENNEEWYIQCELPCRFTASASR